MPEQTTDLQAQHYTVVDLKIHDIKQTKHGTQYQIEWHERDLKKHEPKIEWVPEDRVGDISNLIKEYICDAVLLAFARTPIAPGHSGHAAQAGDRSPI